MHPKILPHAPSTTISKKWKTSGEKLIYLVRDVQTKLTWTSTNILNAKTFSLHRYALNVIDSFEWRDLSSEECISRVRSKGNIRNYRNASCICQHHQKQRLLIHVRCQLRGRAGKHGLGKNLLSSWNQCSSLQHFQFINTWISCTVWMSRQPSLYFNTFKGWTIFPL